MHRVRADQLLALIVVVISGCGTQTDRWKDAPPETAPVSGVVTFQGEPLEGAIVVFQPNAPTGMGASAVTDDDGRFELRTFPPDLGAVPGRYTVSIMKTEILEPSDSTENEDDPPPIRAISLIPEKYGIPTESKLSAEIPDEGIDSLVFDLKK